MARGHGLRANLTRKAEAGAVALDLADAGAVRHAFLELTAHLARTREDVHVMDVPPVGEWTAPIVYTVPLQLLAYHVAVQKGTDVDQPRNLAKSVTVE